MTRMTILLILVLIGTQSLAQKHTPFRGMLEYKITPRDTSLKDLIPENKMIIYTNDTIVRIENFTGSLGKQVAIRHLILNKSYLLLNTDFGNFAIQMNLSDSDSRSSNDTTQTPEYQFKKKWGKDKILRKRAKRVIVSHASFNEPIEFLYYKKYRKNLIDAFPEINGLPVRYSLPTSDAILDYELVRINSYEPDRDLFGISSDYERISFDDFMDRMIESKQTAPPPSDHDSQN